MRTVAVFNQKGGCGKTTTAIHLSACLAEAGKRTLIADLDPQGHATLGCNVKQEDIECSTFECLAGDSEAAPGLSMADVAWEILPNLYLAPATLMLSAVEQRLAGVEGRENRLAEALGRVDHVYDWAVIDCGPSMNILSINALRSADTVLIPVETGYFSLRSLDRARDTVDLVAERTGHRAQVVVLPTMYDPRTKSDRAAYRELKEQCPDLLAETTVRFNAKLKEAAASGSPITEFFPGCRGHRDYQALAHELMAQTFAGTLAEHEREGRTRLAETAEATGKLTREVLGAQVTDRGVIFRIRASGAQRVQLAGSFNNWNPDAGSMVPDHHNRELWRLRLPLPEGRHEYRLVVDGRWTSDPENPHTAPNEFGELNSVVEVGQ